MSNEGYWQPGNCGKEEPTTYRTGAVLLWCWNPVTKKHAYLNCETDMILSDEEAQMLRGDV